jgi:hypothetical protein
MKTLRRHLNYANVVATLALLFAMSGGALAANQYLINSTKQINPKVLKRLRGTSGKRGAPGTRGLAGAIGATGGQGPKGEGLKGETGGRGPSDVFHAEGKPPLTVSVPAGQYVVAGKVTESNGSGLSRCDLENGKAEQIDASFGSIETTGVTQVTMPSLGTVSLAAPDTITLECQGPGAFSFAQLTATQVAAIH